MIPKWTKRSGRIRIIGITVTARLPVARNRRAPLAIKLRAYEGGCHCERVRFRVTADLSTATICNCSMCTKKGIVHLIVPQEQLLCGKDNLTTYTFNTGVAKHTVCKHCGIHPFYVPRSDPDKIDVNVRCIDEVDLATLKPEY